MVDSAPSEEEVSPPKKPRRKRATKKKATKASPTVEVEVEAGEVAENIPKVGENAKTLKSIVDEIAVNVPTNVRQAQEYIADIVRLIPADESNIPPAVAKVSALFGYESLQVLDWNAALVGSEAIKLDKDTNQPVVEIGVLRILGKLRGVVDVTPEFVGVANGNFMAKVTLQLRDGSHVGALGEADPTQLEYPFNQFPLATADTRAESRALRRLLRIEFLCDEEVKHQKKRGDLEHTQGAAVSISSLLVRTKMAGWSEEDLLEAINKHSDREYRKLPDTIGAEVVTAITDELNERSRQS